MITVRWQLPRACTPYFALHSRYWPSIFNFVFGFQIYSLVTISEKKKCQHIKKTLDELVKKREKIEKLSQFDANKSKPAISLNCGWGHSPFVTVQSLSMLIIQLQLVSFIVVCPYLYCNPPLKQSKKTLFFFSFLSYLVHSLFGSIKIIYFLTL